MVGWRGLEMGEERRDVVQNAGSRQSAAGLIRLSSSPRPSPTEPDGRLQAIGHASVSATYLGNIWGFYKVSTYLQKIREKKRFLFSSYRLSWTLSAVSAASRRNDEASFDQTF
jgi:hypothetical protein